MYFYIACEYFNCFGCKCGNTKAHKNSEFCKAITFRNQILQLYKFNIMAKTVVFLNKKCNSSSSKKILRENFDEKIETFSRYINIVHHYYLLRVMQKN